MNVRQFLPAVLFVGGIVALVALAWVGERTVPLVDVVEGPRPPVTGDAGTQHIVLRGLLERFQSTGNALRKERNEIAERHARAVEAWRKGTLPLREVENLEQLLWVARYKVGEIEAQTLHTKLAELFAREARRLELLGKQGLAGPNDIRLAWLYTARERHLAGLPNPDPKGPTYAQMRAAYLKAWRRQHDLLLESRIGTKEQVELEWDALQKDFPEPDAP